MVLRRKQLHKLVDGEVMIQGITDNFVKGQRNRLSCKRAFPSKNQFAISKRRKTSSQNAQSFVLDGTESNSDIDYTKLLPDETLLHIFKFLEEGVFVARASAVCRKWNHVARSRELWKQLYLNLQVKQSEMKEAKCQISNFFLSHHSSESKGLFAVRWRGMYIHLRQQMIQEELYEMDKHIFKEKNVWFLFDITITPYQKLLALRRFLDLSQYMVTCSGCLRINIWNKANKSWLHNDDVALFTEDSNERWLEEIWSWDTARILQLQKETKSRQERSQALCEQAAKVLNVKSIIIVGRSDKEDVLNFLQEIVSKKKLFNGLHRKGAERLREANVFVTDQFAGPGFCDSRSHMINCRQSMSSVLQHVKALVRNIACKPTPMNVVTGGYSALTQALEDLRVYFNLGIISYSIFLNTVEVRKCIANLRQCEGPLLDAIKKERLDFYITSRDDYEKRDQWRDSWPIMLPCDVTVKELEEIL